jgi:hypothetical protein
MVKPLDRSKRNTGREARRNAVEEEKKKKKKPFA